MARAFKMHRAGPARPGIGPLGRRRATPAPGTAAAPARPENAPSRPPPVEEIGGPAGPEPTRYGDWERNGICYDF